MDDCRYSMDDCRYYMDDCRYYMDDCRYSMDDCRYYMDDCRYSSHPFSGKLLHLLKAPTMHVCHGLRHYCILHSLYHWG